MGDAAQPSGPDLTAGIAADSLADGSMLAGHVDNDPVLLARVGPEIFAIDGRCTHYSGPLSEGLMVGETVRCPWHHACFSLRTGEALAAPALSAAGCWRVERNEGRIYVRERLKSAAPRALRSGTTNADRGRFVIVGGGAAGFAAAEMLRRQGYDGSISLISADAAAPYDRPNLSKDYLAGTAPEDWIPLRPPEFYKENDIDLRLDATVSAIDLGAHRLVLGPGETVPFAKLLLATGAEPIRLQVPGAELPHVRTLRSLQDSRDIGQAAARARRVVVIGASFIGMEAAAALRQRDVDVHVVAPVARPMERVLGPAIGDFVRGLHEGRGVRFHLGHTVSRIDARSVWLDDGSRLEADLVLVGIGVRPRLELAERAGLALDRGVMVNEYLETSAPGIFAAGDIARWPDPHSGERLRIEHWVVAERQGQTAARNMMGSRERYSAVPFFCTQHYDVSIDYVGHAATWDRIEQDGDLDAYDVALRFYKGDRQLAVATIFRGCESLQAEHQVEQTS